MPEGTGISRAGACICGGDTEDEKSVGMPSVDAGFIQIRNAPQAGSRMTPLRMLDLFSGSGNASRAAAVRGWEVVRIDNAEGTAADIRADLEVWMPPANEWFDLVWASPPCTQLSTAGKKRNVEAGLVLVDAALRIIRALAPRWWVLENVHGATRAIGSRIGPPVACYGSFYLWGVFPPFDASVRREKTKLSGRRRAERRAAIPWAISDGLVRACENLAKELPPRRPRAAPELAPSAPCSSPACAPVPMRSMRVAVDGRPTEISVDVASLAGRALQAREEWSAGHDEMAYMLIERAGDDAARVLGTRDHRSIKLIPPSGGSEVASDVEVPACAEPRR